LVAILHFTHAFTGGAGRAARRAHLACRAAGIESEFAFVEGDLLNGDDAFRVVTRSGDTLASSPVPLNKILTDGIQWDELIRRRTSISNSLLSIPYPGVNLDDNRLFETAEIIHLHWPTWAVTPRQLANWLRSGRVVFWTLHDFWAMTGGCHYPAGCEQYKTICMKCPQLSDDPGFVPNSFAEKLRMTGNGGALWIITPSEFLAQRARKSAILGGRPIASLPNAVELDVFRPPPQRDALRAGVGIGQSDLVLLIGSYDLREKRKGFSVLTDALNELLESGALAECLPAGANVHIALLGKSAATYKFPNSKLLNFGAIDDDAAISDILGLADLICAPSLEDNYPNLILEGMSCGTPSLGFATGGVPEMIRDGVTGILEPEVGSPQSLRHGILRFVTEHFGDLAMRSRCRAAAEEVNDPEKIGRRLRELYEDALGRPLRSGAPGVYRRVAKALAKAEMPPDDRAGTDFLQFPINVALADRGADARFEVEAPPGCVAAALAATRLITVRTRHEHHSAHSGPYQFIRHLPGGIYDASHFAVPLGAELVGAAASLYQKAGTLLGTRAFGQQANNWLAEAEVATRCIAKRVDLVHFIDGDLAGWLLPSLPMELFGPAGKPKVVTTFHQPPAVLEPLVSRKLLAQFDGIIVLCEAQKDYLCDFVDPAQIFLVPHGIDVDFFRPVAPGWGAARRRDRFQMLVVGHWLRDFDVVFAALDLIEDAGIDAELTIVSPRPVDRADPRVIVRSALSDEELREAYWSTDALILPLLDATANNAILEAMACGKPVISTLVGGVPEMVGSDGGLLCPPRDARALADAAIRLARSPEQRAAMGQAARERATALDWRAIGRLHHEVYQTILARRNAASCKTEQKEVETCSIIC
jgi:glycosyltransferase involved in cell wall biosynthesis